MSTRVVHFEFNAEDPERAAAFYNETFGWTFDKWSGPVEYWRITTGDEADTGINGGMMRPREPGARITNTIQVPSLDDYVARIKAAGGSIVVPKMAVPGVGWMAHFADTEGNVFGIMQQDPTAG